MHASQLYTIEQFLQRRHLRRRNVLLSGENMQGREGHSDHPGNPAEGENCVGKKRKYINGSVEKFLDFMKER